MGGEVSFFEVGVDDPDRACAFYGSLFGWTFEPGPSGRGAVIKGSTVPAGIHGDDRGAGHYLFLRVDDLDVALARVRELGGTVDVHESDESAESVARFGRFALCADDQGSRFGLHQAPGGGRAELAMIMDAWFAAIVANDAERIGAFMAEEWTIVSASGPASRERFLSLVASGELTHSAMDRVGEADVQMHGGTAVVTVRVTNTAHYGGRRFDADEWTTDVFVRRDGRWLCVLSHITTVADTAN